MDGGASWTAISPEFQGTANSATDWSGYITALVQSPTNPNLIFAGTVFGQIFRTTDGGTNWTRVPPDGFDWQLDVTSLAFAGDDSQLVATYGNGYWVPTSNAHVFYTQSALDASPSWSDVSGNLPTAGVNAAIVSNGILYIGTDIGSFATELGKDNWGVLGVGLPTAEVESILISPSGDLIAGTHGRGAFMLTNPAKAIQKTLSSISLQMNAATGVVGGAPLTATVIATYSDGSTENVTAASTLTSMNGHVLINGSTVMGTTKGTDTKEQIQRNRYNCSQL